MFEITEEMKQAAAKNGSAHIGSVWVENFCKGHPFYTGVAVEACYYESGACGIDVSRSVRFASPEAAEKFQRELVELICRHTHGKVR